MRFLYSALLYLLIPAVWLRLMLRGRRNPAYRRRIAERFGFVAPLARPGAIWVHAVSVGETRASAPLVRALMQAHPTRRVLITTMTPTGSDQVRALFGDQVDHCYVPYDLPTAVRRFLTRTRPVCALIMETELWPNLFYHCRRRGIPVMVANARMSAQSQARYARFAGFTRFTLQQLSLLAVQNAVDAERLRQLGAPAPITQVTGSIKFDIQLPAGLAEQARALRSTWGAQRPVWIAASTHEGEDEPVLAALAEVRLRHPSLVLILVPRHPERFGTVERLGLRAGLRLSRRSSDAPNHETEVLLGDTMGELQLLYAAADVAFIGGSLVPTGGHNVLEACAVGVPCVFGPHMFNFDEIARLCLERGAAQQIDEAKQLGAAVGRYLDDAALRTQAGEAGRQLVEHNRGALARSVELINAQLRGR